MNNHFNFLAPIYDRVIKATDFSNLEGLLEIPVSGVLLDAGGGTGRVSNAFVGKASSIVVADLSHPMLKQTRKKKDLSTRISRITRIIEDEEIGQEIIHPIAVAQIRVLTSCYENMDLKDSGTDY